MAKYTQQDRRTLINWFPALRKDPNFEITSTHAAKIIAPNVYHSKIGTAWDIKHSGGDVFDHTEYGSVFIIMKRRIADRYLTDMKKPQTGRIIIKD